ncbi:Two-component response regulator, partial [human gut metagenome]
ENSNDENELKKFKREAEELLLQMDLVNIKNTIPKTALEIIERIPAYTFISNPKSIITRTKLLDELWDAAGEFVNDNT